MNNLCRRIYAIFAAAAAFFIATPLLAQTVTLQQATVADYSGLTGIHHGNPRANMVATVADATRGGTFRWRSGDRSANITADPGQCVWVAPASASTGASGAWEREVGPQFQAAWCNVVPGSVTATAWQNMVLGARQILRNDIYFRAGNYTLTSKPSQFQAGTRLHGLGLSLTTFERGYNATGGETDCFLQWGGEGVDPLKTLNGGIFNALVRPQEGTTGGGSGVCFTTQTDTINSWFEMTNVVITYPATARFQTALYVDGRLNALSGGQGLRDLRTFGVFAFNEGTTSSVSNHSFKCYNCTNHSHVAMWTNAPTLISGGGAALTNTTDFRIDGTFLGSVTFENTTRASIYGNTESLTFASTATNSFFAVNDRGGGITVNSPTVCGWSTTFSRTCERTAGPANNRFVSTDDTATQSDIYITRDRATPAAGFMSRLRFTADDSGGDFNQTYAGIGVEAQTITNGAEDGRISLQTTRAGSFADRVHVGGGVYAQGLSDPGPGKANFTEYQVNGVPLSGGGDDATIGGPAESDAPVYVRRQGAAIEWGHSNTSGFRNVLGSGSNGFGWVGWGLVAGTTTTFNSSSSYGGMAARVASDGDLSFLGVAANQTNAAGTETFKVDSANGVAVNGLTITSGAGAASGSCTTGSLYLNTSGGASTTLYVCTATNTWTAK